jgi:hypothetical protein
LNGNWDLTGAAYKYADIIHKPQGKTNNLSVKGSINNAEVEIAGLNYVLNSLSLNAAGSYRFAEDRQLIFAVDTNQFQIQDVAPMVPRLERYLPKGKVKTAFQGKWKPAESESIALNGHTLLSGVSLKATESMKPLEDIIGNIRFTGDSLQTSMLSARLGNTTLYATGSLAGRKNPLLDITFSSPVLDFSDIGFHGKTKIVAARNVRGSINFKDDNVQIRELSGRLNKSLINMHGVVEDIHNPKFTISITSPHLELDDIMPLGVLEFGKKQDKPPANISGLVTVSADSGRLKQFPFKTENRSAVPEQGCHLQPTDLSVLGGSAQEVWRISSVPETAVP